MWLKFEGQGYLNMTPRVTSGFPFEGEEMF